MTYRLDLGASRQEIPWKNLVVLPKVPTADIPLAALPLFSGDSSR
jgi:hypothetical protein